MTLQKFCLIILVLFYFTNTSFPQKEIDFDNYYATTEDGRICLKKGKYVFTVDTLGNQIGPKVRLNERESIFFKKAFTFPNNLYIDYDNELGKYAFFDVSGKQITPYEISNYNYRDNVFTLEKTIKIQNKLVSLDKKVVRFENLELKPMFAPVETDNLFTQILCKRRINEFTFSEGLCLIQRGHKYGFINKNGKDVIPVNFEEAKPFSDGLAAVLGRDSNNRPRWGFIDKLGKLVIPYKLKHEPGNFSCGVCVVFDEDNYDKKGVINKNGDIIVPTLYGVPFVNMEPFINCINLFIQSGNYGYTKCQLINSKNEVLRDFPFHDSLKIPAIIFESGYILQESISQTKKYSFQQEVVDSLGKTIFIADAVNYTIQEVLPNRYMYYISNREKGFRNSSGKIIFKNL